FDSRVGEEGLQAIVVALENGIELVVVAAGTAEGHADESSRYGIGDVVKQFLAALHQVARVGFVWKVAVEAGSDEGRGIARVEFVAGDLLFYEAVIGLIGVQTIYYVIA